MNVTVRKARLQNISSIRKLAIESVVHGIPHTREMKQDEGRKATRESLKSLEIDFRMRTEFPLPEQGQFPLFKMQPP